MPMATRTKLTKAGVEALPPGNYYVYDDDVKGLAVRVRQSGGKHYVLRLRVDKRQRWHTIGEHGNPYVPETARAEARRVLGLGAQVVALRSTGSAPESLQHPVEAREAGRVMPTLAEFALRYLKEHAAPHKKPRTLREDLGLLGLKDVAGERNENPRTILAALGDMRLDRIQRGDIVAFHLSWDSTPTRANRALSLLSHIFAVAEKRGLRESNPCRGVERFGETKRERYLSPEEFARVGKALAEFERSPFAVAALRLLMLTGARASEILNLKWSDIRGGSARLADSKTGAKTIVLPPAAQKILKGLERLDGNPYVIPSDRLDGRPLTIFGLDQIWAEIREAAGVPDVRVHDLRHTFASVAVSSGASLPVIGAMLGQTRPETTARYAHLFPSVVEDSAKKTAGRVAAALAGPRKKAARKKAAKKTAR